MSKYIDDGYYKDIYQDSAFSTLFPSRRPVTTSAFRRERHYNAPTLTNEEMYEKISELESEIEDRKENEEALKEVIRFFDSKLEEIFRKNDIEY